MGTSKNKLSTGLSGVAGEYFVAAELSRRGFMASITLRNSDSIDIHASKLSKDKVFSIQVKTNQSGARSWILSQKAENNKSKNFYYVFVALKGELERPDYFVVPSTDVAKHVKENHSNWLSNPGRKGQARKDSSMRKFDDGQGKYLERWDLLE